MLIMLVAGRLVMGSLPQLGVVPHAFSLFLLVVLVPLTTRILSYGDYVHSLIGIITLVFVAATHRTGRLICKTFNDSLVLRIADERRAYTDGLTSIASSLVR